MFSLQISEFIRLRVCNYAKYYLRVIFQATLSSGNQESLTERNSCLELSRSWLTPDFRSNRRLVVRVCRNATHCQGRKCVRKCCLEDVDDGVKINCSAWVSDANKGNFYKDLSNFTNTTWNATGLFFQRRCKKKIEKCYPEAAYFIRHKRSYSKVISEFSKLRNFRKLDFILYEEFLVLRNFV